MSESREFNSVYDSNVDEVYRFCLRAVSRPAVAEDLTSEVFLLLYERQYELVNADLSSWLLTTARRRAADFWRHHYVEQRWPNVQLNDPIPIPLHEFSLENVLEQVQELDGQQCAVLILRYRHQMSYPEVAYQMRTSVAQVKSLLRSALQLIRDHTGQNPPPSPDLPLFGKASSPND
ncbi:MAG: sigma-70 family RNA polymerase sigma factor [Acidobacteriota bacterium]